MLRSGPTPIGRTASPTDSSTKSSGELWSGCAAGPFRWSILVGRILRAENWIGQEIDAQVVANYEAWRFYTSGQFNQLRSVDADWRHAAQIAPLPQRDQKVIEVWEILFYLTEVFEFAARLSLTSAGDETMTVVAALHGLDERGLIVGQHNRAEFFEPRRVQVGDLEQRVRVSREELVAEPRDLAVDMAREFFVRFGWEAGPGPADRPSARAHRRPRLTGFTFDGRGPVPSGPLPRSDGSGASECRRFASLFASLGCP